MNREQKERLMEKIEYDIKSDIIAQEEKKKIKRKEQENKKLKEELKEQTGGLRPELKRLINKICRKYDIEAKTYHEKIVEIIHSLDDCNQALIEIKEIAKNMNKECFYDDFDCEDCDMKNGCTYQGKIKILQKISEVENDR